MSKRKLTDETEDRIFDERQRRRESSDKAICHREQISRRTLANIVRRVRQRRQKGQDMHKMATLGVV